MSRLPPPARAALMLVVALLVLPFADRVVFDDRMPVRPDIPERLGTKTSTRVLYCHTAGCPEEQFNAGPEASPCPKCGERRFTMSKLEKELLPPDTLLQKARVAGDASSPSYVVSIVISSRERSSIHRPEVCLVGQGSEIVHAYTHPVGRPGARPLPVRVLEMLHHVRKPDGSLATSRHVYAYWFRGGTHETASHTVRMWWMAWDRIVHGTASRWAYIAVAGPRDEGRGYLDDLDPFIRELDQSLGR